MDREGLYIKSLFKNIENLIFYVIPSLYIFMQLPYCKRNYFTNS